MASSWCPGAVRSPQTGAVTLNKSLPARATWHITWDQLRADGSQPAFSAVSNYLKNQKYCPHLMWNPVTGYIEQYYPAGVGARALAAWNEDGAQNIQIEVFFTPGEKVNGKTYNTVAETPCRNLDVIMNWLRSLGIKDQFPLGAPKWQGNSRAWQTWNAKSGHYGHCHVPDNDHSDPGPLGDIFAFGKATAGTKVKTAAVTAAAKAKKAVTKKKTYIWLPSRAERWGIYRTGAQPVTPNIFAYLTPKKYGGLRYEVKGWTVKGQVALIDTQTYGRVQVYVGPGSSATIKTK